jgi:hypothetical protein
MCASTKKRMAKTAACAATIVSAAPAQAGPYGIASDDKAIYWTDNGGGTVMKVAQ